MSQTFSLICHETKQQIWIGQGWGSMTSLYSGEPQTMENLRRFLNEHKGKPLLFVCNDEQGDEVAVYREWHDLPLEGYPCGHSNLDEDHNCADCGKTYLELFGSHTFPADVAVERPAAPESLALINAAFWSEVIGPSSPPTESASHSAERDGT